MGLFGFGKKEKDKMKNGLEKTRTGFWGSIMNTLTGSKIDDDLYDELEEQLILAVSPAPFCSLDEIEAALDDANVVRFAQYLPRVSDKTQFIVITHRRGTMEAANVLYGVTMQEDGVSKLLKLDLEQVDAEMVS